MRGALATQLTKYTVLLLLIGTLAWPVGSASGRRTDGERDWVENPGGPGQPGRGEFDRPLARRDSVERRSAVRAGAADPASSSRQPKTDLFDRFDDEQSPLQKGMLDARDNNWRKRAKLGSDPRCSRLVREFTRKSVEPAATYPKLCHDAGGDPIPRTECLETYCCDDPDACPELLCANALIDGDDLGVCFDKSAEPDDCISEIFGKKADQPRVIECLDDPLDDEGRIRSKCRKIFEQCPDLPLVNDEKDTNRSGTIWDAGHQRQVGRRIQTTTKLRYYDTKQRGQGTAKALGEDTWDSIRIRRSPPEIRQQAVPGETRHVDATLSAGSFNAECDPSKRCVENDDGDCYDSVTGALYTSEQCFDADDTLRKTLAFVPEGCELEGGTVVCCRHVGLGQDDGSGEVFYGADCLIDPDADADEANLKTTLIQMIDEDPFDSLNNDGDCTDDTVVTSDCLREDGTLRSGFHWNIDEEGDCQGSNTDNDCMGAGGRIGNISGDTCVHDSLSDGLVIVGDRNDETLPFVELIDEDCAESGASGRGLDNDGDGAIDEDPQGVAGTRSVDKLAAEQTACEQYYRKIGAETGVTDMQPTAEELPDETKGCDLTRAMRVHVNWKVQQDPEEFDRFKQKNGKEKFFHVDSHGNWCDQPGVTCDPDPDKGGVIHPHNNHDPRNVNDNSKSYKYEERNVTIDEVFAVKCKPVKDKQTKQWVETYYDEATGTCLRVDASDEAARWLKVMTREGDSCTSEDCVQAMMGFTFAPPVLEWGWRVKEQVCIFGFCFELFYARVGYEFDLAAGLRLPVQVDFDGVPESVLATDTLTDITAQLTPLDFDTADFSAFCRQHDLDDPWYIANCDRFAFPDFLDDRDGDEFVAHYSIFAGIIVRLLSIPLVNFGVDSSVDIPAMCTVWKMKDGIEGMSVIDLVKLELGLLEDGDVLATLKEHLGNCGSFTTPFGFEQCDPVDPGCPLTGERLRAWPFLSLSKKIRADCFDAMLNGEYVTVKGKKVPICTGLIVGTSGASLGVGLGIETTAGSLLIKADWEPQGDAASCTDPPCPTVGGELAFERSADDPSNVPLVIAPVVADNYADRIGYDYQDHAIIALDDFTYFLNAIEITLSATLEFGGILSPIPDIGTFPIYNFVFDTTEFGWDGIPIPQHPDTGPAAIAIHVENYGLDVDVAPDEAQQVKPGCDDGDPCPDYGVWVTNVGSVPDDFDAFRFDLSNRQVVDGCDPEYVIDPNNDHDCIDAAGQWHREDPFDGRADACFDRCGHVLDGVTESVGEDPVGCLDPDNPCLTMTDRDDDGDGFADEDGPDDAWTAGWYQSGQPVAAPTVEDVPQHEQSMEPVVLRVSPLAHPFTTPGIYPFRVTADSVGAKTRQLPDRDPIGYYRIGAPDEAVLEVTSFFDPQIQVVPGVTTGRPGIVRSYSVEVRNGSNTEDTIGLTTEFLDHNAVSCDLVTLGSGEGCPYRAVPTAIPSSWLVGAPPDGFGPLVPSQFEGSEFGVLTPTDWAGMEETVYRFEVTASSVAGPPAQNVFLAEHRVTATQESRTRYVGLEIEALIASIEQANSEGIDTAGLHPIATRPVGQAQQRALERIVAGDTAAGTKSLRTCIKTTEAFLHALEGSGGNGRIPEPWYTEFERRARAIVTDLERIVAEEGRLPEFVEGR